MSNRVWDKKYSTDEYIYTKTANRFVIEYCEPLKGKTAIDLAGGEGRKLAKAIKRLAKNVKPGGHLFGVWHSRDNLAGGFGGPRDPKLLPNIESITKALKGTGLTVEVLTNRDGQIQTREGLKPSITLVLLAKRESN